jgi:hypothetical protein
MQDIRMNYCWCIKSNGFTGDGKDGNVEDY